MNIFYIMRHGQTEDNLKRIIQGQNDSALTEKGIDSLINRSNLIKDIQFDQIYCSPLPRAKKSLKLIMPYLSYAGEIEYADELKEIDFGIYSKQPLDELKAIIEHHKTNPTLAYPQGESGEQLITRVCLFMDKLIQQKTAKTYLMVTHFGVLETIATKYATEEFANIKRHNDDIARLSFINSKEAQLEWMTIKS